MKRPAATPLARGKQQKPATNPIATKLAAVSKALSSADLEDSVKEMLVAVVDSSLGIYADERHEFQIKAVEMIGVAMTGIHQVLTKKVADAQAKLDGAGADKVARETAVSEGETNLVAKQAATTEKESLLVEETTAYEEADRALKASEAAQVSGDADLQVAVLDRQSVEEVLASIKGPLKEGAATSSELKHLLAVAKKAGCEDTLLSSVPSALKAAPAERGVFSSMVVGQLEESLSKCVDTLATKIADGDTAKLQRASAVEEAKAALDRAACKKGSTASALAEAKAAQKEATAALKEAKASLKSFDPEMKQAASDLKDATDILSRFVESPNAAFQELKDRATPAPEKPMEVPVGQEA